MRHYHLFTILNIQFSVVLLEDFSFYKADGGAYIHSKHFYCKDVYKMQCRNSMIFRECYKLFLCCSETRNVVILDSLLWQRM